MIYSNQTNYLVNWKTFFEHCDGLIDGQSDHCTGLLNSFCAHLNGSFPSISQKIDENLPRNFQVAIWTTRGPHAISQARGNWAQLDLRTKWQPFCTCIFSYTLIFLNEIICIFNQILVEVAPSGPTVLVQVMAYFIFPWPAWSGNNLSIGSNVKRMSNSDGPVMPTSSMKPKHSRTYIKNKVIDALAPPFPRSLIRPYYILIRSTGHM